MDTLHGCSKQYKVRNQLEPGIGMSEREKKALRKEERKRAKKEIKRLEMENTFSYKVAKYVAVVMDKYFLDPILGLIPGGVGDTITSVIMLPYLYVSLFKIRSIPLTLALIYNMLFDILLGLVPFWIGNILDFFNRSSLKNYKLVTGFVEGDEAIIKEVNRKATWMFIGIIVLCVLIYLMFTLFVIIFERIGDLLAEYMK